MSVIDILFLIAFAALGAVVASFVMLVAERTLEGKTWIRGRSRCDGCARELRAFELVPIFSWLFLRGRCGGCRARIPAAYPIGEAVLALLFALTYIKTGLSPELPVFLAALALLLLIVHADLLRTLVPRGASALLFLAALIHAVVSSGSITDFGLTALIAGGIGLAFFFLHAVTQGRAMGLGDAPVALSLALLVGYTDAVTGLLYSFWIGAIIGIAILVVRSGGPRMGIEVPFVPFLALGFLLAHFTSWSPFSLI